MSEFVLQGGTLIDGTGAPAAANPGIPIRDARFGELGARAGDTVDCEGLTILPGLIDAHTHFGILGIEEQYEGFTAPAVMAAQIFANAGRLLDSGFTTARDVGGVDGGLARAIEEGLVRGPRLLPSGAVICQSGGHGDFAGPWMSHPHGHMDIPGLVTLGAPCDGPDEVRKAARANLRHGATQLKVCVSGGVMSLTDSLEDTQLTVDELRAAVEEARARSTYVTAHAHTIGGIRNGLAAGVECFEHGTFLDEDTITAIADARAAVVPTFAVIQVAVEEWQEMKIPENLVGRFDGVAEAMERSIKLAYAAGIPIGSGSDLFGPTQRRFGLELAIKARVLGPMEAILSATSVNARIIRRAHELGTIERGKLADVTVVRGNPLADPELFDDPGNVVLVIKDGVLVKDAR